MPFISSAHLDFRIAVFAAGLSRMCGLISGLASALRKPGLATFNAKTPISHSHVLLRRSLVTVQIAISIVLLSGAALLLRSFMNIEEQDLGMQTAGVLTVNGWRVPWSRYNTSQLGMDFLLGREAAFRRLPGTRAVAMLSDSDPRREDGKATYGTLTLQCRGGRGLRRELAGQSRSVGLRPVIFLRSTFPSFGAGLFQNRIALKMNAKS